MTQAAPRRRFAVLAPIGLLAGLAVAAVYLAVVPPVNSQRLTDVLPLLTSGRFDEAEARLNEILAADPDNTQANMLMAQAALVRPDPKARLALRHLSRVQAMNASVSAFVRLYEGKAYSAMGRNETAEASWREALRIDPMVPEAGWNLLGLYQVQRRRDDAHRLALDLLSREPDPLDRVQLLLELVRQDAQPISADSLIATLSPIVEQNPDDPCTASALGYAYVKNSRVDEGLPILRRVVDRFPDHRFAWDVLLSSLDESGTAEEFAKDLERLPAAIADDPRFIKHRAALAFREKDWARSADGYLIAHHQDLSHGQVLYRLCQTLRLAGRANLLGRYEQRFQVYRAAADHCGDLYKEANAISPLDASHHAELFHRLARLREEMGRPDEAAAWHRLVLDALPDDPTSLAALERLDGKRDESEGARQP